MFVFRSCFCEGDARKLLILNWLGIALQFYRQIKPKKSLRLESAGEGWFEFDGLEVTDSAPNTKAGLKAESFLRKRLILASNRPLNGRIKVFPEIREQRSENRDQRSEIRGQRPEIRGQRPEIRDQGSGVSSCSDLPTSFIVRRRRVIFCKHLRCGQRPSADGFRMDSFHGKGCWRFDERRATFRSLSAVDERVGDFASIQNPNGCKRRLWGVIRGWAESLRSQVSKSRPGAPIHFGLVRPGPPAISMENWIKSLVRRVCTAGSNDAAAMRSERGTILLIGAPVGEFKSRGSTSPFGTSMNDQRLDFLFPQTAMAMVV